MASIQKVRGGDVLFVTGFAGDDPVLHRGKVFRTAV
jgi:hypothetical protein